MGKDFVIFGRDGNGKDIGAKSQTSFPTFMFLMNMANMYHFTETNFERLKSTILQKSRNSVRTFIGLTRPMFHTSIVILSTHLRKSHKNQYDPVSLILK